MGFLIPPRGGSKVLVDAMLARIQTQPETGKRVAGVNINLEVPSSRYAQSRSATQTLWSCCLDSAFRMLAREVAGCRLHSSRLSSRCNANHLSR